MNQLGGQGGMQGSGTLAREGGGGPSGPDSASHAPAGKKLLISLCGEKPRVGPLPFPSPHSAASRPRPDVSELGALYDSGTLGTSPAWMKRSQC